MKSEACKLIRAEELQAVCACVCACVCVLFWVIVSVWCALCFVRIYNPTVHTEHLRPAADS